MTWPARGVAVFSRRFAAHLLQAFFHGVFQLWLTHPEAFDLNAAAQAMVETMIAGLVAAPPRRIAAV